MIIGFVNDKTEKVANDTAKLDKLCRKQNAHCTADDIVQVINELYSADSCHDIPPTLRPHPLAAEWRGYFAVNVSKTHRIIFRPDHDDDPEFHIDNHKTIKRIVIVELCKDYHKR